MTVERRDFLRVGSVSLAALLFGACDSSGPAKAEKLLDYATKKN